MATNEATEAGPGEGEESLGVTNGKIGMWTFLVMDAMTFAGFLAGYARLRWSPDSEWPNPFEEFGVIGIQLTAFNTFVLICSSVSMVHVLAETIRGNMKRARKWMLVTIIGGLIFLGIQGFEWTHLILDKWPYLFGGGAEVDYNMNFAATFLSLTGFHGAHVSVGVIYNTILLLAMHRGKIDESNSSVIEIAGLYWHFVDLIWILVFTFVYLI
ncbi:MAG: cytochrome c oxidase subunit 3 [Persicimonas sp.]